MDTRTKEEVLRHRDGVLERECRFLEEAEKRLGRRQARLIDVGCGPFSLPEVKRDRLTTLRAGAVGIDLNLHMLKRNPNIAYAVCASCYKLPFPDKSIDIIVSRWVFEHLEYPGRVMCEFSRVLRPGGFLYIKTPNLWNYGMLLSRMTPTAFHNLFRRAAGLRENSRTYYRANTSSRLKKLASGTGFAVQSIESYSNSYNYYSFNRYVFCLMRGVSRMANRVTDRSQQILMCIMQKVDQSQEMQSNGSLHRRR